MTRLDAHFSDLAPESGSGAKELGLPLGEAASACEDVSDQVVVGVGEFGEVMPGAVQSFVVGVEGHQRVVGAHRGFGEAVDDRADGFGVQRGTESVLGHAACDPVVDGHDQFDSATLDFEDHQRVGVYRTAAADQSPLLQHREIAGEPEQRTADHAVSTACPDK